MKPAMEQAGRQHESQENQADRQTELIKEQMQQAHEMRLAGVEQQGEHAEGADGSSGQAGRGRS